MDEKLSLDEIQQASFIILQKIKEICKILNINYSLAYGTLIGAIRHKGFIPWDDDIDVIMKREDYNKFIEFCIKNKETIKPFELKSFKTDKKYLYPISRLSDSRYKADFFDGSKHYEIGTFVDIYPFDKVENEDKRWLKKLHNNIRKISIMSCSKYMSPKGIIKKIFKPFYYLITRFCNLNNLINKQDVLAQKYNKKNSSYVGCVLWDNQRLYNSNIFDEFIEVEFNGDLFSCIKEYDYMLRENYGDYMQLPPEEERIPHHYYDLYKK